MAQPPTAPALLVRRALVVKGVALVVGFALANSAAAVPTIWSGLSLTFTRPVDGPSSDPANQDRITDNVWLTRDSTQGIFNIKQEEKYDKENEVYHAPADTLWATDLNNMGKTIAATNYQDLAFTYWRAAYNGTVGASIINRNAVVHLLTDDIYLDLRFTDWGGPSGGFAYMRAVAPSAPTPTGDYNANGTVDAADYAVWRGTFTESVSPNGSGADGNANGTIDAGDYDFWKARFGNPVPGSGASLSLISVPEPTVISLAVLWLSFLACCRLRTISAPTSTK